ncbi:hypothetical protein ACH4XT_00525 [Streptomyces avidinii]|uniref:hypothetical protein n=1 Tax=Streptomyces avidinii TaxID=1895 RepID=UPI00378AD699
MKTSGVPIIPVPYAGLHDPYSCPHATGPQGDFQPPGPLTWRPSPTGSPRRGPSRTPAAVLRSERSHLLVQRQPDGSIPRARRRTDRTPADERRTLLGSLRIGDVVTGTVASGLHDVGVRSELPDATFEGGDEVRVTLLDVDLRRRRIGLAPDG